MSLYTDLKSKGNKLDSHCSDLYVRATSKALAIIKAHGHCFSRFIAQDDKQLWFDVPFAYDPYWEKVQ